MHRIPQQAEKTSSVAALVRGNPALKAHLVAAKAGQQAVTLESLMACGLAPHEARDVQALLELATRQQARTKPQASASAGGRAASFRAEDAAYLDALEAQLSTPVAPGVGLPPPASLPPRARAVTRAPSAAPTPAPLESQPLSAVSARQGPRGAPSQTYDGGLSAPLLVGPRESAAVRTVIENPLLVTDSQHALREPVLQNLAHVQYAETKKTLHKTMRSDYLPWAIGIAGFPVALALALATFPIGVPALCMLLHEMPDSDESRKQRVGADRLHGRSLKELGLVKKSAEASAVMRGLRAFGVIKKRDKNGGYEVVDVSRLTAAVERLPVKNIAQRTQLKQGVHEWVTYVDGLARLPKV